MVGTECVEVVICIAIVTIIDAVCINKHKYKRIRKADYGVDIYSGYIYRCEYCEDEINLEDWQLRTLPKDLAGCKESTNNSNFREFLSGGYNCIVES